jgi:hypothetical protein
VNILILWVLIYPQFSLIELAFFFFIRPLYFILYLIYSRLKCEVVSSNTATVLRKTSPLLFKKGLVGGFTVYIRVQVVVLLEPTPEPEAPANDDSVK